MEKEQDGDEQKEVDEDPGISISNVVLEGVESGDVGQQQPQSVLRRLYNRPFLVRLDVVVNNEGRLNVYKPFF